MNKRKKPSLTVAIPAYNEEKTIENLILSILNQKQTYFNLREILIYTDACMDNTIPIIKKLKNNFPIIRHIKGRSRRGKMYRINQIFSAFSSDLLVNLDADIKIANTDFLNNIVKIFIEDPKALLVGCHSVPMQPENFVGKILHATYLMWDYIRLSVPKQDHVQNYGGSIGGFRGSFARTLHIPDKATEDRIYIYLMAKEKNGFRYSYKAVSYYWAVTTIRDYLNLAKRSFGSRQPELEKIFGERASLVHIVPMKYKIKGILKSFYHQPLYTPLAIFLGFMLSKLTSKKEAADTGLWGISTSSKRAYE